MNEKKLDDRQIVQLLLDNGSLTVPKLCKLLADANPNNVTYHLNSLIERNIVVMKKKRSKTGPGSYGSLYSLSEQKVATSRRTNIAFAATLVFLVFGLLSIAATIDFAIISLAISAGAGTLAAGANSVREKKEKIKMLLELV